MRYPLHKLIYDILHTKDGLWFDELKSIVELYKVRASDREILNALMKLDFEGLITVERRRKGGRMQLFIYLRK